MPSPPIPDITSIDARPNETAMWIKGAFACWGAMMLFGLVWAVSTLDIDDRKGRSYLLPWTLAAGVVILTPSLWLIYKRRFDPFHPIVLAGWSYFFPGFFVGSLLLAAGVSEPQFLLYVSDERYNLPLTLVYAMVGYACLSLGFLLPYGRAVGRRIAPRLPEISIPEDRVPVGGVLLLGLGLFVLLISLVQGLFGYQRSDDAPIYNGVLFLIGQYWILASFVLWLYVFRARSGSRKFVIAAIAIGAAVLHAAFAGNRGSLLQSTIVVAFAFVLSGVRLSIRHYVAGAGLVLLAVFVGMIYGTAFRMQKGSQESVAAGEYTSIIGSTVDRLSKEDPLALVGGSLGTVAERLDATPSLAVVVSRYEALAADEERWGISNNIMTDSLIFFVPRLVWPDKPIGIDPQAYAELYFNYRENSFTMTPMGDLLRNFGPAGVPIGMLLLGFLLRIIYSSLVEGLSFSYWRLTLYFMLISSVSYEGTFGLIVPTLFKIGAATLGGIAILYVVGRFAPLQRR